MMSLDDIKYVFQIPSEFFRRVNAACFKSYPGFLIDLNEHDDGSFEISVNKNQFEQAVKDLSGDSDVKTVDDVYPDENGNIKLDALTENDLGVTVANQDDLEAVKEKAENAASAAEDAASEASSASSVALNAQSIANDASTAASNAQSTANAASLALTQKADKSHSHGNLTNDGKVNVNYVNGGCLAAIDSNGNISAASFVSEESPYVTPANVKKILSTCNLEVSGTVTLKGSHVKLSTASKVVETDENGCLKTSSESYAKLTDSNPSSVGLINSVGTSNTAARADHVHAQKTYTASKWMKTDEQGNIGTTDDSPLLVDSTKSGFVLNSSGTISYVAGKSGTTTLDVVTQLSWNGTQLVAKNSRLIFTDGILTGVSSLSNTTINTVTY